MIEVGERKQLKHDLAVAIVDSATYLKGWLLEQEFPYSAIPFNGVGLTSNSIVKAILVKNNAYHLWSKLNCQHLAPGTGPNDPGIPGYNEPVLRFPMIGELLFWIALVLVMIGVVIVLRRLKTRKAS